MSNCNSYERRAFLKSVAATGITLSTVGASSASAQSNADDEEIYVVLADGDSLRYRLKDLGFEILHEIASSSVYIIHGPKESEDELRSLPVITDVLKNQAFSLERASSEMSDDTPVETPSSDDQWYMEHTNAFEGHDVATGDGTTVAIIDTGIDHTHPDLEPRLDVDRSRLFRNGAVYSGSDQINVASETEPVEEFVATDVEGHGTHVAGIAAASRTEGGIVGVAPEADLISLRSFFFEDPTDNIYDLTSTLADLLVAVDYAVEMDVDVINISLSAGTPDPGSVTRRKIYEAMHRVVEYAIEQGTAIVTAMGNNGVDMNQFPGYILPASNTGTISVAAVGPNDKRSHYSDYGDSVVTVAAPGGEYETPEKTFSTDSDEVEFPFPSNRVLSTVPEALFGTKYEYFPGTSAATPQVAGLACLLRELEPDSHPRTIEEAIEHGAIELTGDYTSGLGAGRMDVPATIEYILDS